MTQGQSATPEATADPVSMISAMLDAEQAPAEPAPNTEAPEPVVQPQDDAEPTPPDVEGDDAPQEEQAAMAEIPLEQLEGIALEVTVKGEDGSDVVEKPTIKELREGYMRRKDYSRKTAEVARQREEVPEKIRQGVEGERTAYLQQLQQLNDLVIESVAPELKNVDWNNLSATDPFEYVRLKNRSEQLQNVLSVIKSKQQEVTKKQEMERSQALQKVAQQARQTLEDKIPGWNDQLYQQLMESAVNDYGYRRDEVAAWVDPKAFQLLHDANEFRKMKAAKPVVDKRVVSVPKAVKPGTAQAAKPQQKQNEAFKKLQSSGRFEDAAAVIRSRLG